MSDARTRTLERSDTASAALLAARLRAGEVSRERVAYAAALGHPVALAVVEPSALPGTHRAQAERGCELLGRVESVRWACDLAEAALAEHWKDESDTRPAEAIAAARAWAVRPCEEHRTAAWAASEAAWPAWPAWPAWAAWAAARAAAEAAWAALAAWAAWAAWAAARSAAWTAARSAAWTAAWEHMLLDLAGRLLA